MVAAPSPPELPLPPSPDRGLKRLWIGLAAVAAVAIGAFAVKAATGNDDSTAAIPTTTVNSVDSSISVPSATVAATIPATTTAPATTVETTVAPTTAPETTIAVTAVPETTISVDPATTLVVAPPVTFAAPTDGITFTGAAGWTLQISPTWTTFDVPNFQEEIAWATGGGEVGFGSNINVITETPSAELDLQAYLDLNLASLATIAPGQVVSSGLIAMPDGRTLARVEYTATFGREIHFVVYMLKSQTSFVVATFGAPPDRFAAESPLVEPYLATLSPTQP